MDKLGITMTVENIWDKELKTDTIINRCWIIQNKNTVSVDKFEVIHTFSTMFSTISVNKHDSSH